MKRVLQITMVLVLLAGVCAARQSTQPMQRIHAAKMAYLTDRLHLTATQSAQFVPIYNNYEKDMRALRVKYRMKYKIESDEDAGDVPARQRVDDDLDYQQDVIVLKRKYNDQFLTAISAEQLADMYVAEREFRQLLIQRLKQRRAGRGR